MLSLSEIDLAASRIKGQLKSIEESPKLDNLRSELLEASEALLNQHAKRDQLAADLKRVEADVELVDGRISQDARKVKEVASDRELKAVEAELVSLNARKSTLEETELELMEAIDESDVFIKELTQNRAALSLKVEEALSSLHQQTLTLTSNLNEKLAARSQAAAQVEQALLEAYERKSQRGLPVGQTLGRDCSACRLAINGTQFEAMMSLPEDSLPTCPNCDAFIIR